MYCRYELELICECINNITVLEFIILSAKIDKIDVNYLQTYIFF